MKTTVTALFLFTWAISNHRKSLFHMPTVPQKCSISSPVIFYSLHTTYHQIFNQIKYFLQLNIQPYRIANQLVSCYELNLYSLLQAGENTMLSKIIPRNIQITQYYTSYVQLWAVCCGIYSIS